MFGKDFENILVVDGRDAAVGEVETQDVDYAGGVMFYGECLGWGLVFHAYILVHSSAPFPFEIVNR